MSKKKIVILGAGISGLSLAWKLSKNENYDIVLLEQEKRSGGWIRSEQIRGFFFERGPHTFSTSRSASLLRLAEELGMQEEILYSNPSSKKRFLYLEGKLRSLPKWPLIKGMLREMFVSKAQEEESIYVFASRRFGQEVAQLLFDPMTMGVYAGDMHTLSVDACFPALKRLEREHGSVTKGFLAAYFKKKRSDAPLFTFKQGVESVTKAIAVQLQDKIHYEQTVQAFSFSVEGVEVITDKQRWHADHLFCALPAKDACALFAPHDENIAKQLEIPVQEVSLVSLGFQKEKLSLKGFGYLVPTKEQESILGVIFDSLIFPEQNNHPEELRLSVWMRRTPDSLRIAEEAIARHLGITTAADVKITTEASIPQYTLGHRERMTVLQAQMREKFPRCTLLGNYMEGVSVNDCIAKGMSFE